MCAPDDFELGKERARVLRRASTLARMRGVSRDRILSALMTTQLYKRIGEPNLSDLNLTQAKALSHLLARWIEKVGKYTPNDARAPSAAPPAPWHEVPKHHTEEGNDQR